MTQQLYIAQLFQSGRPNAEMSGQLFSAIVGTLRDANILPIREKHGLIQVDPDHWYSQQKVLDFLKEVDESLIYEELVAIGMNTPGMEMPESKTLSDVLDDIRGHVAIFYRNVPNEEDYTIATSGNVTTIVCNVPFPSYLVYGWIYGLIRGYLKDKATDYIVRLDETVTPFEIIIEHLPPDDEA